MLQARRDLDLAQEPLGAERARQLGAQHLDRDLSRWCLRSSAR